MRKLIATFAASIITLTGCVTGYSQPLHPDTTIDCMLKAPAYPALSRKQGETGTAAVKATVDEAGRFISVVIAQSSGFPRLDEAALAAMRASTCQPLYHGGERVPFSFTQPYHFAIRAESPPHPQ
ncbi:energy transducer TonB [Paraburkholderia antibiotica]|uniref:Energy transducer TonB n=1 Tax=Paraburkholderia antibiotica TaxID=2728839 RepID=A0A7X9X7B3_9BURK|nr:energy transducer TonB [Paraburkholderia antibiotica]NML32818.1 energy transducer TonB [Paraburkholderia antibiotica]